MTALAASDRQRLAKLLGLLGSDHAGERDAAGLAAHRLIRDRGLTWGDVIHPNAELPANRNAVQPWRETVAECLRHPRFGSLTPWERDFLRLLPNFIRLSAKQRSVLGQIADRVSRRAAA
jgi:hypothetical protein